MVTSQPLLMDTLMPVPTASKVIATSSYCSEVTSTPSYREQRTFWRRFFDFLEGANTLDFDKFINKHHKGLKARMKENVIAEVELPMTLAPDVYNLYWLTLIKQQADFRYLHVEPFKRFFWKSDLGGWPMWTFLLQTVSCILVIMHCVEKHIKNHTFLARLEWDDWVMVIIALCMAQYMVTKQMLDIRILEMKLQWLVNKKCEPGSRISWWLTDERVQALHWVKDIKAFVTLFIFACNMFVILMQSDALVVLKKLVVMLFVSSQSQVAFALLEVNDKRRQLGYEGALYAGLANFDLDVMIEERPQLGKRPGRLWWTMRIIFIISLAFAILRFYLLHDFWLWVFERLWCIGCRIL